ncbi:Ammonium transporter 1 [Hypsibius exemplaris]|uniref:Ammonium transporter n=1 Tax=Hypsibius exemplaris TaxID=2072580 RepID=A0A1W0XDS5_HYPEX|nr:Ammonium transporter 1 [Hypsibius exemplaris]
MSNTTQPANFTETSTALLETFPVDKGSPSTGFITWGAALVFFMTPGLALFYSGLSKHNNALSLMMLCMMAMSIVTIQFYLFGFSLAFSERGDAFIGDFKFSVLDIDSVYSFPHTTPQIPSVVFLVYQMQCACIAAALIFGSVPERVRFVPGMVFILVWTTVVYDFVAYWSWSNHGWIRNFGCLKEISNLTSTDYHPYCHQGAYDFSGGGPIHIASGFSGLAYCLVLGKRRHVHVEHHSLVNVMLGTGILWFGWFAGSGGAAGASNTRAAVASTNTTIAGAAGALSWAIFDYFGTRKLSALSFCSGAVAGLVAISSAAGFVAPWAALIIGIASSFVCALWTRVKRQFKKRFGFDDTFAAFSVHGCGGVVGYVLTGVFAQKWVAKLDGTKIDGGGIDGNGVQVYYQIVAAAAIAGWSFFMSLIFLLLINLIPGLQLRQSKEDERLGGDFAEMGEVAYRLMISEPDDDFTDDVPVSHEVGVLADGKRIAVATDLKDQLPAAIPAKSGSDDRHPNHSFRLKLLKSKILNAVDGGVEPENNHIFKDVEAQSVPQTL